MFVGRDEDKRERSFVNAVLRIDCLYKITILRENTKFIAFLKTFNRL